MLKRRNEVLRLIEGVIEGTPGVSGAAYFGSIATNRFDAFSDIDLVVRCPRDAENLVVAGLDAALGMTLFRPFTAVRRPSGRYWFEGVSPFLRLDLSFHEGTLFDALLVRGKGFAQPPFAVLSLGDAEAPAGKARQPAQWSELEFEFGGALRQFHEAVKSIARGIPPKRPVAEAEAAVLEFEPTGLRPEIWDLYRQSVALVRGAT